MIIEKDYIATDIPEGYMADDKGRLVHINQVKDEHKLENQLVRDMFAQARHLNSILATFKAAAFSDVEAFLQLLGEKYGIKKGGRRGNLTLTSYDGLMKVQLQVSDSFAFGPELQIAKQLIDDMIKESSGGADEKIIALVNHAFSVDKQGQVNRGNILGLRRLNIQDAKWEQAMQAITDSMRVTSTSQYIRFYCRPTATAQWQSVTLDFAGV
jgi:hypothetical protein